MWLDSEFAKTNDLLQAERELSGRLLKEKFEL